MDRIATLLDERGQPALRGRDKIIVPMPDMRRQAHVSGNQVDVLHCPFCGSGAVVARSDGSIECSFCNSAFTVTVSPVYPAFPMSVNGQPYPWPGRPADGMDPAMMGDPNAAAAAGDPNYGGSLIPGGGGDPDADPNGDGNPFADGGDESDDEGGPPSGGDDKDDKEAEVGGKKQPPFGKKKSYLTATGALLPEDEYVRHLAIATAADPNAMAARVRESRG